MQNNTVANNNEVELNKAVVEPRIETPEGKITSEFRPMLLGVGNFSKIASEKSKRRIIQYKYDGIRCCAISSGETNLFSRHGNLLNMPEIKASITALLKHFPAVKHVDGEIYNHGTPLQDIASAVKGSDTDKKKEMWYQIYDLPIPETTFESRLNIMAEMQKVVSKLGIANIKFDLGVEVQSVTEMQNFTNNAFELGYEGAVLSEADAFYKEDTRSCLKLKLKNKFTEEFKVVSHYFGKGKCAKMSTLIVATKEAEQLGYASSTVFESFVKTKSKAFIDKYYFHVVMMGSHEKKEEMAANFDRDFKDKMITTEFYSTSKNNVPLGAKGITVRDYE